MGWLALAAFSSVTTVFFFLFLGVWLWLLRGRKREEKNQVLAIMARMPLVFPPIDFRSNWWNEINDSVQWQDGIFYTLCALYALVSSIALVINYYPCSSSSYAWFSCYFFRIIEYYDCFRARISLNLVTCLVWLSWKT